MTDLDHLAELLHGATPTGRSNVAGLLATLDSAPDVDADTELEGDVTARRIESEAEAVQVMTVWTAKGLEFPIVCVPTLWRRTGSSRSGHLRGPGHRTARPSTWPTAGLARPRRRRSDRKDRRRPRLAGERLRLLYVALTRAQHHTIVWWANGQSSARTALARVLFARHGAEDRRRRLPRHPGVHPRPTTTSLPRCPAGRPPPPAPSPSTPSTTTRRRPTAGSTVTDPDGRQPLEAARFTATLDRSRRRWSFTAITDQAAVAVSDPYDLSLGDGGAADERSGDDDGTDERGPDGRRRMTAPDAGGYRSCRPPDPPARRSRLRHPGPRGARTDRLLGAGADELGEQLGRRRRPAVGGRIRWTSRRSTNRDGTPATAADCWSTGSRTALRTPLGPLCHHRRLADIGPGDRLNELSFDLRLGEAGRPATVADIGRVVVAHLDPDDPLRAGPTGWPTGAIDVRAGRPPDRIDRPGPADRRADGGHRFRGGRLQDQRADAPRAASPYPDDYHPTRMAEAMVEHDYPLQALLYSVALHRYLRWRLPGYRPADHLGGAVYLFVRGMAGPGVAVSDGHPHGCSTGRSHRPWWWPSAISSTAGP